MRLNIRRSTRIFGLLAAITLVGVAIGPAFGGVVVRFWGILSIFYITAFVHLVFALSVWIIVPESLAPSKMLASRRKWAEARFSAANAGQRARGGGVWRWAAKPFVFLAPLHIFLPVTVAGKKVRDWSLLRVVLAQGCTLMVLVSALRFRAVVFCFWC